MHRLRWALVSMTLATLSLVAISPPAAFAATPSPTCESGAATFDCDAASPGATTWTVTITQSGYSSTFVENTTGNFIHGGCSAHSVIRLYYSYVSGGVTQTSTSGGTPCRTGPQS